MEGLDEIARRIPKVSLHCHLFGSVPASTAVELAHANGGDRLGDLSAATIYHPAAYANLTQFLSVYGRIGHLLRSRDDFRRITYESLTVFGADYNVWYREIFVSPQLSPLLPYRDALLGVCDGIRDAKTDTGIDARIIMAINREHTATQAVEFVQQVIEHRVDEVVGIGLDGDETKGAPESFAAAFALAHRAGLSCTAHSENGPPRNIEVLLEQLHCTRVDHGYHIVADERITRRCADEEIVFTTTPVSADIGDYGGCGGGTHHRIKQMIDLGLKVCVDSDDPPMFGTDPGNDYYVIGTALNYQLPQLLELTRNAIDGSWLDETDKKNMHKRMVDWTAQQEPRSDIVQHSPI